MLNQYQISRVNTEEKDFGESSDGDERNQDDKLSECDSSKAATFSIFDSTQSDRYEIFFVHFVISTHRYQILI